MPSTSCMNHAPASVAAAITVIASAAVSAGLAAPRACEGFASGVGRHGDLLWRKRPSLQASRCRGRRDHRGVFCRFADTVARFVPRPRPRCSVGGRQTSSSGHRHPISSGFPRHARVDRPSPPAIFRRLRDLRPSGRCAKSPCGGIGRRARTQNRVPQGVLVRFRPGAPSALAATMQVSRRQESPAKRCEHQKYCRRGRLAQAGPKLFFGRVENLRRRTEKSALSP